MGAEADLVDGFGVDEVEVITGGEDGGMSGAGTSFCMAPVTVTWAGRSWPRRRRWGGGWRPGWLVGPGGGDS